MPYQRSKAARLRELKRLTKRIRELDVQIKDAHEARNALLLDNLAAEDPATSLEIGAACGEGFGDSAVRNAMRKLRAR